MPVRLWAVGLFILGGLGLLTALLFVIGSRQQAFSKHVDFETQFSNLDGIGPGSKVRVSGLDAGKIKSIDLPTAASEKFRLTLELEEKVHALIHTDSLVSIETEGVVGDKFLLVKRGSDQAEIAQPNAMLPSKEPFDLSAMMDKATLLLNDVHSTVGDVRGRVDGALDSITKTVNHTDGVITDVSPRVQKMARDGSRITGEITTLVSNVTAGKGAAGLLLQDADTRQQVQATLTNVKDASNNLSDVSSRADQVISDFQSRGLVDKTQATLENVQSVTQQLDTTVKTALTQDTMGEDGASNLRQSLSNLNRSTANLAEDTEALKHNFFFRGFFKKRGFFSMDQITPAEYRTSCEQHKDLGVRLWLQAPTLVAVRSDGQEELSEAGRHQIDMAVAPVLNRLPGHLIVVEGYAPGSSSDTQFLVARHRADQVRRYMESHFHLRHTDVGVVALASEPPQNADRTNWDGAAIMLLDAKAKK